MITKVLLKFFSLLLKGIGQTLFGTSGVLFLYYCFFSGEANRYIFAGVCFVAFLLSFGFYYLGGKLSDFLYWKIKDSSRK